MKYASILFVHLLILATCVSLAVETERHNVEKIVETTKGTNDENENENENDNDKEEEDEKSEVLKFSDVDSVSEMLERNQELVLLVAFCSSSCLACDSILEKLKVVASMIESFFGTVGGEHRTPRIGMLEGTQLDPTVLQALGVSAFPSLHFFQHNNEEVVMMEYIGQLNDERQIFETSMHYWYRHTFGTIIQLESLSDLKSFVKIHGRTMLHDFPLAVNPDYNEEERKIILSMMQSDGLEPYVLFVVCDEGSKSEQASAFTDLAASMSTHRSVAFFALSSCVEELGDGDIFSLFADDHGTVIHQTRKPPSMTLEEFLVVHSTPSILWFDRISTAPIAFPLYRKLHAVLIVPLEPNTVASQAVVSLRTACRRNRVIFAEDMVCIVVPDTETRVLALFGIDIWGPLDSRVTREQQPKTLLPALFITDQRQASLHRHYLDATAILESHVAIEKFLESFWLGRLDPDVKSETNEIFVNEFGVKFISGLTFDTAVLGRNINKHCLLYLFAPPCGHCKRFSLVWNKLSQILRAGGWDDFVDIMQLDVSKNEIVSNKVHIDPAFLPAVYYFPAGNKEMMVKYSETDRLGNGVGGIDDPFQIISWMLSIGEGFDELALLEQILE